MILTIEPRVESSGFYFEVFSEQEIDECSYYWKEKYKYQQ